MIMYDAAHVLGLIAGRQFQTDIFEYADVVTSSTHKTFPSVQGGLIMTNEKNIAKKIEEKTKNLIANIHAHRIPALAVTALEMKRYGKFYASQIIKNAKTLARKLDEFGFNVVARRLGYTESHQVIIKENNVARKLDLLEKGNIIASDSPFNKGNSIRLGTQEMTRFGMKEREMEKIAEFMKRIIIEGEEPYLVKKDVIKFRLKFQKLKYCFSH